MTDKHPNAYEQLAKEFVDVEYQPAHGINLHQFQQDALRSLGLLDGERRYTVGAQGAMDRQELLDGIERMKARMLEGAHDFALSEQIADLAKARTTPWRDRFVLTIPKPVDPWWPRVTGGKTKIGPTDV